MTRDDKPIIETLINTAAIALSSFAVVNLTTMGLDNWCWLKSLFLLFIGMGLECFKYIGRERELW